MNRTCRGQDPQLGSNVERWVQVWQITDPMGQPLAQRFPSPQVHRVVKAAQDADQDCYHVDGYDATRTLMEALGGRRPHLALHTIRRDNLPSEDDGGKVVDLSISVNSGLAEGTHFIFCPRNIVVCLYNHHGPRIRRLGDWLDARMDIEVGFIPLYRLDAWGIIESMNRLSGIEITIPAAQARALAPAAPQEDPEGLLEALRATGRAALGGQVHLSWTVGRGEDRLPQSRMRALASTLYRMNKDGMSVARIRGRVDGVKQPVPVDLIHDQLVTRRTVEPEVERSRRLNAESAYAAMEGTYEEFKEQIREAVDQIPDDRMAAPGKLLPRPAEHDDDDHSS